jgi:hypothetical protein
VTPGGAQLIVSVSAKGERMEYQCSLCGQVFWLAENRTAKEGWRYSGRHSSITSKKPTWSPRRAWRRIDARHGDSQANCRPRGLPEKDRVLVDFQPVCSVLLVSGFRLFREATRALIERHEGFQVIGETDDWSHMFRLLDSLRPEVILTKTTRPPMKFFTAQCAFAMPDLSVDGTIVLENLSDVVFVERPVFGQPNTTITLFKIDPDSRN